MPTMSVEFRDLKFKHTRHGQTAGMKPWASLETRVDDQDVYMYWQCGVCSWVSELVIEDATIGNHEVMVHYSWDEP